MHRSLQPGMAPSFFWRRLPAAAPLAATEEIACSTCCAAVALPCCASVATWAPSSCDAKCLGQVPPALSITWTDRTACGRAKMAGRSSCSTCGQVCPGLKNAIAGWHRGLTLLLLEHTCCDVAGSTTLDGCTLSNDDRTADKPDPDNLEEVPWLKYWRPRNCTCASAATWATSSNALNDSSWQDLDIVFISLAETERDASLPYISMSTDRAGTMRDCSRTIPVL